MAVGMSSHPPRNMNQKQAQTDPTARITSNVVVAARIRRSIPRRTHGSQR
jgi:hypothetical protein